MHTTGSTRRLRQRIAPARAPSPSESPLINGDVDTSGESQPHEAKRARKVMNCEPCRTNKLKCDRKRPCSSCELRGTSHQCYRDTQPPEIKSPPIDPLAEIQKIRQSIASIEQHIRYTQSLASSDTLNNNRNNPRPGSQAEASLTSAEAALRELTNEVDVKPEVAISGPGAYGRQAGGLYAGPTSTSSHLVGFDTEGVDVPSTSSPSPDIYDHADIRSAMPDLDFIDSILDYYFTYCQWLNPYVAVGKFRDHWAEYKRTGSLNYLVLAVCCGVLAMAMIFIPDEHPLKRTAISKLGHRPNEKLFALMQTAQQRYEDSHGGSAYTLEFAELLLIRGYYYLYATQGGEELWAAKSRVISVATAMGLHRDPSQWKMPMEVAERRRWLWWMILTWSRWQSILIGRPPSIAAHHCDTQFPGVVPGSAPIPEMYEVPWHFFVLGNIVYAITDDALSLRAVPYSNIRRHDIALERWKKQLPPKFTLKHAEISSGVCSDDLDVRRRAVQCVGLLSSYYHIRFTLHRPYASRPPTVTGNIGPNGETRLESTESVGIAATSAEGLINLMISCQCAFDLPPERACSTPGYFAYISFYLFTAAMFFSFHLIPAPGGPRAKQCRHNIDLARTALRKMTTDMPGGRLAVHAMMILDTLEPLWQDEYVKMPNGPKKEGFKGQVLASVRRLAFPFHDPNASKVMNDSTGPAIVQSPNSRGAATPYLDATQAQLQPATFGTSGTLMPDMSVSGRAPVMYAEAREHWSHHAPPVEGFLSLHHHNATPTESDRGSSVPSYAHPTPYPGSDFANRNLEHHAPFTPHAPTLSSAGSWSSSAPSDYFTHPEPQYQQHHSSQNMQRLHGAWMGDNGTPSVDIAQYNIGVGVVSHQMPWGASIGIDRGEWAEFTQSMAGPPHAYASNEGYASQQYP